MEKSLTATVRGGVAILTIGLASTALLLADSEPLSPKIIEAKTAWVLNDGGPSKSFQQFSNALKEWNRFRFVDTKGEADLVIVLSANSAPYKDHSNGFRTEEGSGDLWIRVMDAKSDLLLWSAKSSAAAKLVSLFKKRVQNEEEKMRTRQHPPIAPIG
jgi:hypothetical protein